MPGIQKTLKQLIPSLWWPSRYLPDMVAQSSNSIVMDGPLKGLKYSGAAIGSALAPKLLGCYEKELQDICEEIVRLQPHHVIDIGAAEGYYAVGLALRCPRAKVTAFELTEDGRRLLGEMARHNGVHLDIRGACEPEGLRAVLAQVGKTVVICDCEGYEKVLLDPVDLPALGSCWILVELHEFACPGIGQTLKDRFSSTHSIDEIQAVERTADDFPLKTRWTPEKYLRWIVSENRPGPMSWLWLRPLGQT